MSTDKRLDRLRFRSWHRGTREMDLLLGSFADGHLHALSPEELLQYEALLALSDPDLYNWITGAAATPPEHDHGLMKRLRAHQITGQRA